VNTLSTGVRANAKRSSGPDRGSLPFGAPTCWIYRPSASSMQSGRHSGQWLVEFESAPPLWIDPLMGWTASADPFAHMRLRFSSLGAAVEYTERHGLNYQVFDPPLQRRCHLPPAPQTNPSNVSKSENRMEV
jgi:hypothetical protein